MRGNRYFVFSVVSFALLIYAMQFSMVSVALGAINRDLDAPLRWSGWILTAFMVGQVVSMPMAGRFAERFGAGTVLVAATTAFAAGSLLCAVAPNVYLLIIARAAQGLAGGCLMPAGMGLIGDTFQSDRTRWIGLLGSTVPIGSVIAPSIGGLIVDHVSWRWTFGMNFPLGMLALAGMVLLVPRSAVTRRARPFDIQGVTMLGVSATALIFSLTELGRRGAGPSLPLWSGGFVIAGVALGVLVHRELTATDPAIDLDLLKRREFLFANVLAFLFGAGVFGMFNIVPLYSQVAYSLTATESGALVTPRAIAMVATSMLAAVLLPKTGYRRPVIVGMWGMAGIMVLLALGIRDPIIVGLRVSSFVWLSALVAVAGVAFGFMNPSLNNASIDLSPDRIPAVAGMRGMFMSLGGTIGVTIILLVATRSGTPADGIQISFFGLAAVFAAASFLILGIPEMQKRGLEGGSALSSSERAGEAPVGTVH